MLKIFQEHGRQQKKHLHNIVKRDIHQVYRIERHAYREIKMNVDKVIHFFDKKLESLEEEVKDN